MGVIVTLTLPDKVARRAHQVATETQRPVENVLLEWLDHGAPDLSSDEQHHTEAELLQNISLGFSEAEWQRYRELISKRDNETLLPHEQQELIAYSDALEETNAHRIASLAELALLRQTSLDSVMSDLGIKSPVHV